MARRLHLAGLQLALAAMLLRALLPAGWMPNPSPNAASLLTICTTSGLIYIRQPTQGSSGKDQDPHHGTHHHQMCPFAAAAHLARAHDANLAPVPGTAGKRLRLLPPAIAKGSMAVRAYSSRAPPPVREA